MGCGAPQPYEQLRGSPVVIVTRIDTTLSSRGFRIALAAQCQRQVIDLWCPRRTPPTVRREAIVCPRELDFKSTQVSIRAPWGSVYRAMSDANGIVEIPVDWSGTGVDPLAPGVAGKRFAIVPETKRVESPRGLALDCKLATDEVAPGERVRIACELRNLGGEAASELSVAVSVGGVVSKNLAPKELPGAGSAKLDLVGLTSASAKQGAQVPVALESGALTQKEFDKYDADLVSCLE